MALIFKETEVLVGNSSQFLLKLFVINVMMVMFPLLTSPHLLLSDFRVPQPNIQGQLTLPALFSAVSQHCLVPWSHPVLFYTLRLFMPILYVDCLSSPPRSCVRIYLFLEVSFIISPSPSNWV